MSYVDLLKLFHMDKNQYNEEYELRIRSDNCVWLDYDIKGYAAFYLDNSEVKKLMYSILKKDKQVYKLSKVLPGVALNQYIEKSIIDEIVVTNNIEGVNSTRREIGDTLEVLQQHLTEKKKDVRFLGLIDRYLKLINGSNMPLLTCENVRELYDEIVLSEVKSEDVNNYPDGELFRKGPVSIESSTGKEIHHGKVTEKAIVEYMNKALLFLNDESVESLYRNCIFHYMIEDIHPFYDGNGRLGRFIFCYGVSKELEPIVVYHISKTIKNNIKKYYYAFEVCGDERNKGDLTPFLIMMLSMIDMAYDEVQESLTDSISLFNRYKSMIHMLDESDNKQMGDLYGYLIQAALFSENGISLRDLLELMDLSYVTLKKRLEIVEKQDLLILNKIGKSNYYMMNLRTLDNME